MTDEINVAAIREYWTQPTGVAHAPPGMVELARLNINQLADAYEAALAGVRAAEAELDATKAVVVAQDAALQRGIDHVHTVHESLPRTLHYSCRFCSATPEEEHDADCRVSVSARDLEATRLPVHAALAAWRAASGTRRAGE